VQGARMPVADGFLPRRSLIDGIQRQGDFDEFFLVDHVISNGCRMIVPAGRMNVG
jgi:hypothetical protein